MTKLDELRAKVIENLEDFVYRNFYTKDGRKLRLAKYQSDIIREALKREKSKFVVVSATRVGKSEAVSVLAVLLAILNEGEEIVIVAPIWRQAMEGIFERIKEHVTRNEKLKKLVKRIVQGRVEFKNGSRIYCLTAQNEEGLLGYGASVVIVDEAGSIEPKIIKERILRMLATDRGRKNLLFLIGTPHNMESYLFEAWNSDDFVKYRITWKDAIKAGIMSKEEVEFAKRTLNEDEFAVWYESEWRQLGEDMFFDMHAVREVCVIERKSYSKEDLKKFEIVLGFDPAADGKSKSCIVAVGRLRDSEDNTLYMLDYWIVSKKGFDWQIGWVQDIAKRFGAKKIVVDRTSMLKAVYDILSEKIGEEIAVVGFDFSKRKERFELYEKLRYLIEEKKILLLNDNRLRENFNAFRIKYKSDGSRDVEKRRDVESDIVDSLALAVYGFGSETKVYVAEFIDMDAYFSIMSGGAGLWFA